MDSIAPIDYPRPPSVPPPAPADDPGDWVASARVSLSRWQRHPHDERGGVIARVAEALADGSEGLLSEMVSALGMCRADGLRLELAPCVRRVFRAAHQQPSRGVPSRTEALRWQAVPRGVIARVDPWTTPLSGSITFALEAVLQGNAVLLVTDPRAEPVLRLAAELAAAAGLPHGLLGWYVSRASGEALAESLTEMDADRVVARVPRALGNQIASRCAAKGTPCSVEFVATAPALVCDDADLDLVAEVVVGSRFAHAGQRPEAVGRVIVAAPAHDALVAKLSSRMLKLRVGPAADDATDVPGSLRDIALESLVEALGAAVGGGARMVIGGVSPDDGALRPTLLTHCAATEAAVREALPGPWLPVLRADDDDDLVLLGESPRPERVARVFGRDEARAAELGGQLDARVVLLNGARDEALPEETDGTGSMRWQALRRASGGDGVWSPTSLPRSPWRDRLARRLLRAAYGRHGLLGPIADLW